MSERPIAFLHIPKTAGSTLHKTLKSDVQIAWYKTPFYYPTMAEMKASNAQLIAGHMNLNQVLSCSPRKIYTIIRDPVERVVSEVRYIQRQTKHHLHERFKNERLADIIAPDHPNVQALTNRMCKCLSSKKARGAIRKLRDHNISVAVIENFDHVLRAICDDLGVKDMSHKSARENQAPTPTKADDVFKNPAITARLKEITGEDQILYDFVLQRADETGQKVLTF